MCLPAQDAKDSEGNTVDAAFYRTFWGLQHAFQHPVETVVPDNWTKMVKDVKSVLAEFMKRPVALSGRAPSAGECFAWVLLRSSLTA